MTNKDSTEEKKQDVDEFIASSKLDGYEADSALSKRLIKQASESELSDEEIEAVAKHFKES